MAIPSISGNICNTLPDGDACRSLLISEFFAKFVADNVKYVCKEVNDKSKQPKRRHIISNLLKYAVPLGLSIGLCWLLFTGIDFDEMIEIVRRDCDFKWIAAALVISLFSYIFRALRWQLQLNALDIRVPLFYLVLSMFGTYAVNLVFPRLGEVWRSGYIAQRQDAPFTAVFGSMVAERLADTITVALITLIAFILASDALLTYFIDNAATLEAIKSIVFSPWLWCIAIAILASLWWLFSHKTNNKLIAKIQRAIKGLWIGFAVIIKMPGKWRWLEWTLCVWGCYFTQLLVAMMAFPSTRDVIANHGLSAALVTFALSSLSMGVPSNGGIGPWQWAVIFALGIYGVENATAGAFANVVLGTQTLMQILLGIFTFIMIALDKRRNKIKINKTTNIENV